MIKQLNDQLSKAAAQDSALLLDIARASERDGINAWFDMGSWLHGKLEIAPEAAVPFGDMVARIVAAQRGLSKKCLVFDLDNTLWGGVIGDDGLEGLVLGEGSAVGEAHLALQRYAKQLKERGVILAVCSKNDPAIAEAAFRDHPEMLLRRPDISAFLANWNDKAENLKAIATQLNIGLDSLVFVDDNPVERARIRQACPMVAVPELPKDIAHYVRCLADAGYFEAVAFTSEDRQRTEQYAANAEREAFLKTSESMDDFLRGLQMSVVFGQFRAADLVRVTQLFNKTNQFNTTTRRYTSEEVANLAAANQTMTLQFRLVDKYGDNGLVSAMILQPDPKLPEVFEIDNWVMSCRVFGRQLEFEALNIAVEQARRRGIKAFRAAYIPTSKNGVISELYPKSRVLPCKWNAPKWRHVLVVTFSRICNSIDPHFPIGGSDMTDQEILNAFTQILRGVLLDDSIVLSMQTRREDVPNWDSFNYINFIVAVEIEFGVKFKVADIELFENVGAIVGETRELCNGSRAQ